MKNLTIEITDMCPHACKHCSTYGGHDRDVVPPQYRNPALTLAKNGNIIPFTMPTKKSFRTKTLPLINHWKTMKTQVGIRIKVICLALVVLAFSGCGGGSSGGTVSNPSAGESSDAAWRLYAVSPSKSGGFPPTIWAAADDDGGRPAGAHAGQ